MTLQQQVDEVPLFGAPLEAVVVRRQARSPDTPPFLLRQQFRVALDQTLLVDPESFRDAPDALLLLDSVGRFLKHAQNLVHAADAIFEGSRFRALQAALDREVQQAGRGLLELQERVSSMFPHEYVRIVSGREGHDPDPEPAIHEEIQGPQGRPHAGLVRVEQQDDFRDEAPDRPDVIGRQGRAERGDDVGDPGLMQRDRIKVAFDDDQGVLTARRLSRPLQQIERTPLVKEGGIRRVEVLRHSVPENTAAEADHLLAEIADGQHDARAEPIVVTGGLL